MKAAVVLGASGFIGTRLVRHLAASKCFDVVRAVDIVEPRERVPGVAYFSADVRTPLPSVIGTGATRLYNLAAVHRTPGHPDHAYYDTNIGGALTSIALARTMDISTIIFLSSISVYGHQPSPFAESTPPAPQSAYGRSKILAEQIYREWSASNRDVRLMIVRPGVVFGPGERGNYSILARAVRAGVFAYPGSRHVVKGGGHVDDLLDAMNFGLAQSDREILFNFSYPKLHSIENIVMTMAEILNKRRR